MLYPSLSPSETAVDVDTDPRTTTTIPEMRRAATTHPRPRRTAMKDTAADKTNIAGEAVAEEADTTGGSDSFFGISFREQPK